MKYISGQDRSQIQIECIDDFVDADSEVRIIDKIVDYMDTELLGFKIGSNDTVGRPMFDPKDMLKLYIYGYFNGIRSSRKLSRQSVINREVIWLINGLQPKYRVIADFRKDNIDALNKVFEHFVVYCLELGLYGKELIAIDGTKIEASASKRKHYSTNKLSKMKEVALSRISEYMHDLERNDSSDDEDGTGFKKEEIENAIKSLQNKIVEYSQLEKELSDSETNEINLTDPDAKTVKFGANQGTDVGYNVQAAVDSKNKLIATFDVINNSTDHGQLYNMSKRAKSIFDVETIESLADKGYFDSGDLKDCEENKIICYVSKPKYQNSTGNPIYFFDKFTYIQQDNTYICPGGQKLFCITKKPGAKERSYENKGACSKCKNKKECTTAKGARRILRRENAEFAELVSKRTNENKAKYSRRQEIIEHVFGTLKRSMNFTHFLLRGFKKVNGEVSLSFFCYNLKRVISILGVRNFLRDMKYKSKKLKVAT